MTCIHTGNRNSSSAIGIEPDENGEHDINDYDWQAGCYIGSDGRFLSLAEVVKCIESFIYDI